MTAFNSENQPTMLYKFIVVTGFSLVMSAVFAQGISREENTILETDLANSLFSVPEDFAIRSLSSERKELNPLEGTTAEQPAGITDKDSDNDGLTDIEENQLKTDPSNPDTDGDALLDGWEVHEVNGINLRAMGASPLRKDVFVEMDYMIKSSDGQTIDFRPSKEDKRRIVAAFASAPVANPAGSNGITLHLVEGNQVPHDPNLNPVLQEFSALKRQHFDSKRAPIFHYMIWADRFNGSTQSGYSMGIPSSDFIVTLGPFPTAGGTSDQKVGTFIHEIGHNFGLQHGGSDSIGYKPNHMSVMNYSFQMSGVLYQSKNRYEFQHLTLPSLDEEQLLETQGLGRKPELRGYKTIHQSLTGLKVSPAHSSIDWNGDGRTNNDPVSVDINRDALENVLTATPNEWKQLVFNGGSISSFLSAELAMEQAENEFQELLFKELDVEMLEEFESALQKP